MKRLVRAGAPRPVELDNHITSDEEDPDSTAGPGDRGRDGRGRGQGLGDPFPMLPIITATDAT